MKPIQSNCSIEVKSKVPNDFYTYLTTTDFTSLEKKTLEHTFHNGQNPSVYSFDELDVGSCPIGDGDSTRSSLKVEQRIPLITVRSPRQMITRAQTRKIQINVARQRREDDGYIVQW